MTLRVVIFGGGIAGLAAAIGLKKLGASVKVVERVAQYRPIGHAFNLLPNGLWAAKVLGVASALQDRGVRIVRVLKTDFDDQILVDHVPDNARVLLRHDLHEALLTALGSACVRMGVALDQIDSNPEEGLACARLSDGTIIEGDFFIAADGVDSTVRAQLFPNAALNPVKVWELVASPYAPDVASALGETFRERIDTAGGVAYGFASVGGGRVVWFLQIDANRYPPPADAVAKQSLATTLMDMRSPLIDAILRATDFDDCHLWSNTDMAPLPRFHVDRTALLGDAAHPMVSFSVQGMNSALEDAATLMLALESASGVVEGLAFYDRLRRPRAEQARLAGRALMERFLAPPPPGEGTVIDPALYASIYHHTPPLIDKFTHVSP